MNINERDLYIHAVLAGTIVLPDAMREASPWGDPDVYAVRLFAELHEGTSPEDVATMAGLGIEACPSHTLLKLVRIGCRTWTRDRADEFLADLASDEMREEILQRFAKDGDTLPEWAAVAA
jgi:hypothetical protein